MLPDRRVQGPDNNYIGSWAWNVRTAVLFWSAEHFRICGLEPGSVQPSYELFMELVHPEDRDRVAGCFDPAVNRRGEYPCRYRIVRPDKSIRDIDAVSRPVLDDSGEPVQLIGTIVDITEQRLISEPRANLARMSRIATLGELSASLAHELNQPLAAILANCDASLRWLERSPPNFEQTVLAAGRIRRDALRARAVVERIRVFVQKGESQRASVNLGEAARESLDLVASELQRHRIEVQLIIPPSLPPVIGIRVEFQQVFVSLFSNAIESLAHLPEEAHRTLRVECVLRRADEQEVVCVVVQDSGAGFDDGLGMGLAISRSIIRRHGGELYASDTPEGPRFQFYIPLA